MQTTTLQVVVDTLLYVFHGSGFLTNREVYRKTTSKYRVHVIITSQRTWRASELAEKPRILHSERTVILVCVLVEPSVSITADLISSGRMLRRERLSQADCHTWAKEHTHTIYEKDFWRELPPSGADSPGSVGSALNVLFNTYSVFCHNPATNMLPPKRTKSVSTSKTGSKKRIFVHEDEAYCKWAVMARLTEMHSTNSLLSKKQFMINMKRPENAQMSIARAGRLPISEQGMYQACTAEKSTRRRIHDSRINRNLLLQVVSLCEMPSPIHDAHQHWPKMISKTRDSFFRPAP